MSEQQPYGSLLLIAVAVIALTIAFIMMGGGA